MQIINFERDRSLVCEFRGHYFELERDPDADYGFGNWYMIVLTEDGGCACDGWIGDSSDYTAQQAMEKACEGALLEPPKRWPKEVKQLVSRGDP